MSCTTKEETSDLFCIPENNGVDTNVLDHIAVEEFQTPRWPLLPAHEISELGYEAEYGHETNHIPGHGFPFQEESSAGETSCTHVAMPLNVDLSTNTISICNDETKELQGGGPTHVKSWSASPEPCSEDHHSRDVSDKLEIEGNSYGTEYTKDTVSKSSSVEGEGMSSLTFFPESADARNATSIQSTFFETPRKRVQKPPTTAGITLENLKAVFNLERPEAERRLGLKRTTFSNLSRYYGISKWPFRTIRDATNRQAANSVALREGNLSKEKRLKLIKQQVYLQRVINLMYADPSQSKDSNTLAVLMNIVSSKDDKQNFSDA